MRVISDGSTLYLELHALSGPHRTVGDAGWCLICRELLAGCIARVVGWDSLCWGPGVLII